MHKKRIFIIVAFFLVVFGLLYLLLINKSKNKSLMDSGNSNISQSKPVKTDDIKSREQCFQTLKDNMREAGIFESPLQEIEKMNYEELSSKFSRNYKNLSSFGLDISQGDFEMRLYSFGEQTGYVHPPITPFPTSTKSEMWDEPAKEFILAEEYVTDSEGKKNFIDCAFMSISSDNLKNVTRENYLYDGAMTSLNKIPQDQSYKAWYSENVSFDHSGELLADWKRLFVYPQSSQNEYFDKYSVAEAYPANKVESLGVLKFFLQPIIRLQDYDEKNELKTRIITFDENNNEKELAMPKELEPVKSEGVNKIFPMSGYYQAIENSFPEFSKLLSFRGSLKYETFKKLIAEKEINPEVGEIIGALADYRPLVAYDINKKANSRDGMVVTDDKLDKLLVDVTDADNAIDQLDVKINNISAKSDASLAKEINNKGTFVVVVIVLFLIGVLIIVILLRKRNNKKLLFIVILSGFLLFNSSDIAKATTYHINATEFNNVKLPEYEALGYTCIRKKCNKSGCDLPEDVKCTRNVYITSVSSYGANKEDYRTLTGYANYVTNYYNDTFYVDLKNTPFIYLQNQSAGDISITINSDLNKYYPKPAFNQDNGWIVESKDDKLSVNGEEKDHLFYELEASKITLNRNGRNFSSKEELSDYLQNSDFLTKLGFSEIEKKNSLGYFLPKLNETENKNFYYLTVLSDKAIAEISELNINPKPKDIIRQYFAVYPTTTLVKTTGDFNFPKNNKSNNNDFTAKETGEFLIQNSMQVFFE